MFVFCGNTASGAETSMLVGWRYSLPRLLLRHTAPGSACIRSGSARLYAHPAFKHGWRRRVRSWRRKARTVKDGERNEAARAAVPATHAPPTSGRCVRRLFAGSCGIVSSHLRVLSAALSIHGGTGMRPAPLTLHLLLLRRTAFLRLSLPLPLTLRRIFLPLYLSLPMPSHCAPQYDASAYWLPSLRPACCLHRRTWTLGRLAR